MDELFLTGPRLAGGADAPTIVAGRRARQPAEPTLAPWQSTRGELFTRWRIRGGDPQETLALYAGFQVFC